MLYERRFGPYFVEPVIAGGILLQCGFVGSDCGIGLEEQEDGQWKPYMLGTDLLGAPCQTNVGNLLVSCRFYCF